MKMKKIILATALLMTGLMMVAGSAQAQQGSKDASREKKLFRNFAGGGSTSVGSFCIEGLVFLMANGDVSNQTFIIQVYEEKNGKVVPRRCEEVARAQ